MSDTLGLQDFKNLLAKVTTMAQIKAVIDCLEACYYEDNSVMSSDDRVAAVRLLVDAQIRIEEAK